MTGKNDNKKNDQTKDKGKFKVIGKVLISGMIANTTLTPSGDIIFCRLR